MKRPSKILYWIFGFIFIMKMGQSQQVDSETDRPNLDTARRIVATALTDQKGYQWLRELCDIGPRLSGSENSLDAIEWAKTKMEKIGLDRVELQPVMVPHWVRGDTEQAEIVDLKEKLSIASLGGSIPTPAGGITAEVLEVNSFEDLESKAGEAKGKIVFFNTPMDPARVNTFSAYGDAVRYRTNGAVQAARFGGVAALVRSVTTLYDDVPHVGMMSYSDTVKQIPTAAISLVGADRLRNALKKNPHLNLKLSLSCRTLPDAKSYNVIGEIRGSEKPEEIILVGGHFDSWDKGDGAHDDGASCMQTLEVLDLFKRLNIIPKRTIRCVLFINEENGSRGAKKYGQVADSTKTEIHIAAIEADRGAFTPRGFTVDSDSSGITYLNQWLPYLRQAGIDWIRKGYGGVDISRIKNCPLKIGYAPDSQRYFDYHHSDNDVFSAVHPREFELGSASMAILVYLISQEGGNGNESQINNLNTH